MLAPSAIRMPNSTRALGDEERHHRVRAGESEQQADDRSRVAAVTANALNTHAVPPSRSTIGVNRYGASFSMALTAARTAALGKPCLLVRGPQRQFAWIAKSRCEVDAGPVDAVLKRAGDDVLGDADDPHAGVCRAAC